MRAPFLLLLTVATSCAIVVNPSSADAQARLRGTMRLGGDSGGDRLLEFEYSDGSSPDVTAGGGILFTAGGMLEAFRSGGHGVDAQLNAGLKYRTIPPADNQEATWLRFPVEGLLFYRAPAGVRVGGGATVHMRNVFSTSGSAAEGRVEFAAKPGFLLQAEYLRGSVGFDLRYTALRYEVSGGGSGTLNASSLGGGMSYFFGRKRTGE